MRLIDADMLSPDRDYYDNSICSGYDAVSCQQIDSAKTVKSISLDKIKQSREEMESRLYKGISESTGLTWQNLGINMCLEILDKLIEESED